MSGPPKCCYRLCEMDGLYAATKVGESYLPQPGGLYCKAHVILVAHEMQQEGGERPHYPAVKVTAAKGIDDAVASLKRDKARGG